MRLVIITNLSLLILVSCVREDEQSVSNNRISTLPEPFIGTTTKSGGLDNGSIYNYSSDPESFLLMLTEVRDGVPVLPVSQEVAEEMGIDGETYISFLEKLTD